MLDRTIARATRTSSPTHRTCFCCAHELPVIHHCQSRGWLSVVCSGCCKQTESVSFSSFSILAFWYVVLVVARKHASIMAPAVVGRGREGEGGG